MTHPRNPKDGGRKKILDRPQKKSAPRELFALYQCWRSPCLFYNFNILSLEILLFTGSLYSPRRSLSRS